MRRKDGKIFIPMSIDQSSTSRSSYFLSPFKMAVAMAMVIPGILLGFYSYKETGDNWLAMGVVMLIYMFFYSYLIRFFVLEERRLKRMMRTLEANKVSKSDYFWGIEEIDNDGVIHYRYNNGLKKAVVVKVSRGSLVGKPDDFFETHYEYTLKFLRGLLRNNFRIEKYSKLEPNVMPDGIRDYINLMGNMKDEAQRTVIRMNLDTISKFTRDRKSVIVDYYVVYNNDIRLMKTFGKIVKDILDNSFIGEVYFRDSEILDSDEVVSFLSDVLNIRSVSKKGYYDSDHINFDDYGEIFRLFDSDGNEIAFDLEEEFIGRNSQALRGRSGRSLDSIEEEMKRKGLIFDEEELGESIFDDIETLEEGIDLNKEEVIYVDEDGNEIEVDGDVEYIYVDEDGNELNDIESFEDSDEEFIIEDDEDLFKL